MNFKKMYLVKGYNKRGKIVLSLYVDSLTEINRITDINKNMLIKYSKIYTDTENEVVINDSF